MMIVESVLGALVLAAVGFAAYRRSRSSYFASPARPKPLELAAIALDAGSTVSPSVIVSRSGRFEARRYQAPEDPDTTVVEVHGLPGDIGIVRESVATALQKRLGVREVETGDKPFDDELYVWGPPLHLRTVLDQDTRRLAMRAFRGQVRADSAPALLSSVTLKGGVLQARVPPQAGLALREDVYGDAARTLLDLALRLERPGDIAECLTRNARADGEVQVRLRNLVTLVREYPRRESTLVALREASVADQSLDVRLEAALALGEEGHAALLALLDAAWVDDGQLARAVEGLGARVPAARARALLREALDRRRPRTARACLAALARTGGPEAIETLANVLAGEPSEIGVLAASSLGLTRDPRAEPPLLEGLGHNAPEVREEAARALGVLGSVAAVPPLRALEEDAGQERGTRRAAREAIASIQARLGTASPGQLAIVEAAGAGRLTLPDDPSGRLALDPGAATKPDD